MVFLNGVIPNPGGTPWDDAPRMEEPRTFDDLGTRPDASSSWATLEAATHAFYPDCTSDDARAAYRRLRRQNPTSLWGRYPARRATRCPRIAIIGTDDRTVTPAYSRAVCRTRLGVEPLELPGAHSPFLARPTVLPTRSFPPLRMTSRARTVSSPRGRCSAQPGVIAQGS